MEIIFPLRNPVLNNFTIKFSPYANQHSPEPGFNLPHLRTYFLTSSALDHSATLSFLTLVHYVCYFY